MADRIPAHPAGGQEPVDRSPTGGAIGPRSKPVPAGPGRIFLTFLRIGGVVFGGMWAATQTLEKELVDRTAWLEREELEALYVVATLIPAPRFMGLAGVVGFKLGSWAGSILAVIALVLPTSSLVLCAAIFLRPELLGGILAPLNRSIGIAVVGLLFGNAYHQLRGAVVGSRRRVAGASLSAATFAAIVAGLPLLIAALASFVLGALLIRGQPGLDAELDVAGEAADG